MCWLDFTLSDNSDTVNTELCVGRSFVGRNERSETDRYQFSDSCLSELLVVWTRIYKSTPNARMAFLRLAFGGHFYKIGGETPPLWGGVLFCMIILV